MSVLVRDMCTCQMCGKLQSDTSKLVTDHVEKHHGNEAAFWNGKLQTLCADVATTVISSGWNTRIVDTMPTQHSLSQFKWGRAMGWLSGLFGKKPNGIVWLEGDGDFECEVVGESNYQAALVKITGGKTKDGHELDCVADLVPEPTNRHDRNAIMVQINGHLVGYLCRPHAAALSDILSQKGIAGAQANAVIVGGWARRTSRNAEGHFGVKLDIPL